MKLVILGASGGCGRHLVSIAKERGHDVTAVVRGGAYEAPPSVEVVRGDLTDVAVLRRAIHGKDAVLSALGLRLPGVAPWHRPQAPKFLSNSSPVIVEAMKAEGVKRLLAISAGGAGGTLSKMSAAYRAFVAMSALRHVYPELDAMERTFLESGLDVCIPRPTGLTDGPQTGQVKIIEGTKGRATISRADVAAWMLDEVVKPTMTHKTPVITVTGAD